MARGFETKTKWFWNKMRVWSKNKQNIRNSVLERTKNCLKKKGTKPKTNGFASDTFFFSSRNLYFYLPFFFNDRQTRPNWHKLRGIGALVYTTSTSVRSMLSFSYSFLITQFSSSFSMKTYGTLLHRNTCVLGEKERTSNQWLHLLTNGLVGLSTWTQFFSRALPLLGKSVQGLFVDLKTHERVGMKAREWLQ